MQLGDRLLGKSLPVPGAAAVVASSILWQGMEFHKGDVLVASAMQLGKMVGAVQTGNNFAIMVERLKLTRQYTNGFVVAGSDAAIELWHLAAANDLRQAAAWHPCGTGGLTIML